MPNRLDAIASVPTALLDRWIGFWASVLELVGALYWLGHDTAGWMWRAFVLRRVRILVEIGREWSWPPNWSLGPRLSLHSVNLHFAELLG